jgi:cardiolipin synthase
MADASSSFRWLRTGDEAFAAMLAAMDEACREIRLETYIFAASPLGETFRAALIRAAQRGVKVQVLVDAFGSVMLSADFWQPLVAAGGEFRWFNPLSLRRFHFRDHRKLLACDEGSAFVGGFNIAPEYEGDGVSRGWFDLGLELRGPMVRELNAAFDQMFARAAFRHKPLTPLRKSAARRRVELPDATLLLSGPGRGFNFSKRVPRTDLERARSVQIIAAYFLPTWRLRRALARVAQRGGRVQLILAGQSDVPISQLASRCLYTRLLRAGVEIYEYGPQILHAKLYLIDDVVYAGSANLDIRSLQINYELMVRVTEPATVAEARGIFAEKLALSRRVEPAEWQRSRTFWARLKQDWAYNLLARLDPYLARWRWRKLMRE